MWVTIFYYDKNLSVENIDTIQIIPYNCIDKCNIQLSGCCNIKPFDWVNVYESM